LHTTFIVPAFLVRSWHEASSSFHPRVVFVPSDLFFCSYCNTYAVYAVIFLSTLLNPLSFDGFRGWGIGLKYRDCNDENTAGRGISTEATNFSKYFGALIHDLWDPRDPQSARVLVCTKQQRKEETGDIEIIDWGAESRRIWVMLGDDSCYCMQKQYPHGRPSRGIFCSRTPSLRTITAVGYDMDYTLVHHNAKAKTTPLSLAYVIFEQACQSLPGFKAAWQVWK
jgi:hypothetical protein